MTKHRVVSCEEWLTERKILLKTEKEFTRRRDKISQQRRDLPWVQVDSDYLFEGPQGQESLAQLFEGRSQLIIYHFMYGPDWKEGCPSCSFWADNFNGTIIHLNHRDITMLAVSRAPLDKLNAYKKRMGWDFKWVSSRGSKFNYDYHVSFTDEDIEKGEMYYNYHTTRCPSEAPGVSVFHKDADGNIFHAYSCYARGLDILNTAYHHIDLTPKGRDEAELSFPMAWVKRKDRYKN